MTKGPLTEDVTWREFNCTMIDWTKDLTRVEETRPYFTMIWHNLETAMELLENSIL